MRDLASGEMRGATFVVALGAPLAVNEVTGPAIAIIPAHQRPIVWPKKRNRACSRPSTSSRTTRALSTARRRSGATRFRSWCEPTTPRRFPSRRSRT
eukprot:7013001-Pyramimonas_sp.AAC.1